MYLTPAKLASGDFEDLLAVHETALYVFMFMISLCMQELITSQSLQRCAADAGDSNSCSSAQRTAYRAQARDGVSLRHLGR